jgi:hypothetical protein
MKMWLSKLQLFCGYSFAAISIVALFISSLRRVGVHLTLRLLGAVGKAEGHPGSGLLGAFAVRRSPFDVQVG